MFILSPARVLSEGLKETKLCNVGHIALQVVPDILQFPSNTLFKCDEDQLKLLVLKSSSKINGQ